MDIKREIEQSTPCPGGGRTEQQLTRATNFLVRRSYYLERLYPRLNHWEEHGVMDKMLSWVSDLFGSSDGTILSILFTFSPFQFIFSLT